VHSGVASELARSMCLDQECDGIIPHWQTDDPIVPAARLTFTAKKTSYYTSGCIETVVLVILIAETPGGSLGKRDNSTCRVT